MKEQLKQLESQKKIIERRIGIVQMLMKCDNKMDMWLVYMDIQDNKNYVESYHLYPKKYAEQMVDKYIKIRGYLVTKHNIYVDSI